MEKQKKMNPLRVMVDPHEFMRSGPGKVKKIHWFLALVAGLNYLFNKSFFLSLGYTLPLWGIVLIDLILAIPVGIVIFYLAAFILHLTGRLFKGKADHKKLYSAFAWSRVPVFFQILVWVGLMVIYGAGAFTPDYTTAQQVPLIVYLLMLVYVIFFVWGAIILIHTVAEVQGISAWIAIWNVLFTLVVFWFINFVIEKVILMSLGK